MHESAVAVAAKMDFPQKASAPPYHLRAASVPCLVPGDTAARNPARQTRDSSRTVADKGRRSAVLHSEPEACIETDMQSKVLHPRRPGIRSRSAPASSPQTVPTESQFGIAPERR